MPPGEDAEKLSDKHIAVIERWIAVGVKSLLASGMTRFSSLRWKV